MTAWGLFKLAQSTHFAVIEDIRDAVRARMLFHREPGNGARIVDGFEFIEHKANGPHANALSMNIEDRAELLAPALFCSVRRGAFDKMVRAEIAGAPRPCVECRRRGYHLVSCSRGRRG